MYNKAEASFWTGTCSFSETKMKISFFHVNFGVFLFVYVGFELGFALLGIERVSEQWWWLSLEFIGIQRKFTEEVDLSQDVQQWEALIDSKKHFISHVLAFLRQGEAKVARPSSVPPVALKVGGGMMKLGPVKTKMPSELRVSFSIPSCSL
ncbi:putative oxidoreductase [Rosa chinensis]|uniref:Putative oxidoreductase n=1 Tax=Rosa chinensis TaxID=74649 RepID=A0A2P6Q3U0_ROSCH|nr:putative oxidoreductase [Rosa chinensis]